MIDEQEFSEILSKADKITEEMIQLMVELYPICRSITGNGTRQTLSIIKKYFPIEVKEIKSGTQVFDWIVPKEWNISAAYVISPKGEKIIDFKKSNLHLVNYSIPINKKIPLEILKEHLYTLPKYPDAIPYVTSYYKQNWGFCLEHKKFLKLENGEYSVVIDSKLEDGHLTYGEYLIEGKSKEEILLTCYICHPSLCNDNLSGVVLLTLLAKHLTKFNSEFSIRFLFIPETIGAITWIHQNQNNLDRIKHGIVATSLGSKEKITFKKTRQNNTVLDQIVPKILKTKCKSYEISDFFPWGSDERQFCSPFFNLPVSSIFRSIYTSSTPEYHNSMDNLDFIDNSSMKESFLIFLSIISELDKQKMSNNQPLTNQKNKLKNKKYEEKNTMKKQFYKNLKPKCEPHLTKYGLYHQLGGQISTMQRRDFELAIQWILNMSDGTNSLFDISQKSKISYPLIEEAIESLIKVNLLEKIT